MARAFIFVLNSLARAARLMQPLLATPAPILMGTFSTAAPMAQAIGRDCAEGS